MTPFDSFDEGLMPSQWLDQHTASARDPYTRLWYAVLEDALRCLSGKMTINGSSGKLRKQMDAWEWVLNDAQHPASFIFVCEAVGIEPTVMRARLLKWKESPPDKLPRRLAARRQAKTMGTLYDRKRKRYV